MEPDTGILIEDDETERLAKLLASILGVTLEEAVHISLVNELKHLDAANPQEEAGRGAAP
jgi:hypothetical protein